MRATLHQLGIGAANAFTQHQVLHVGPGWVARLVDQQSGRGLINGRCHTADGIGNSSGH